MIYTNFVKKEFSKFSPSEFPVITEKVIETTSMVVLFGGFSWEQRHTTHHTRRLDSVNRHNRKVNRGLEKGKRARGVKYTQSV